MSADLVLIAGPNDPQWLATYRWLRSADYTLFNDPDDELGDGEYIDADGYLRNTKQDEWAAENGEEPMRGLLRTDEERVRAELGIDGLDHIWIGQVSWLKAGLMEDLERYVPGPVLGVSQIVGDGVVLTPGRAKVITVALNRPNRSIYGKAHTYYVSRRDRAPMRARQIAPGVLRLNKPSHDRLYTGVAPARRVKHWLSDHIGSTIVQESW